MTKIQEKVKKFNMMMQVMGDTEWAVEEMLSQELVIARLKNRISEALIIMKDLEPILGARAQDWTLEAKNDL